MASSVRAGFITPPLPCAVPPSDASTLLWLNGDIQKAAKCVCLCPSINSFLFWFQNFVSTDGVGETQEEEKGQCLD